jgi:hypothetical protein
MSGRLPPEENPQVAKAAALVETVLTSSWQMPLAKLDQPAADELEIFTSRGRPTLIAFSPPNRWQQQAQWLLARMQPWKRGVPGYPQLHRWVMTWDEALQFYLGLVALASDIEWQQPGLLHNAAAPLGEGLGQSSFRSLDGTATQYDSPTNFDSAGLEQILDNIEKALMAVTQFIPGPNSP